MTTATTITPIIEDVPLPLTRFTADEYIGMAESGAFDERMRVELIEGLIVDMSRSGTPHNYILLKLTHILSRLSDKYYVGVQATLRINDRQVFDPDLMLLNGPIEQFREGLPEPDDVQLLIEVAETSWDRDCKVKLPIYAAAGISDHWIVSIERETLFVYRSPKGKTYAEVQELRAGDKISPLAAADFTLEVASVFA